MDQIYKLPDTARDRFDTDPELSYTMPARLYWDRDVLGDERRQIFDKTWNVIAHRSELAEAGAYVTADILGQRIFAIRGRDKELRAFYNVCQHRGHALLAGRGQAKNIITCPYHAWAYDFDGTLQAARLCEDVKGFDKADFSIPAVRVEEFAGFVFANLDPDAAPIAKGYHGLEDAVRRFCPGVDHLKPAHEIVFDIKGNWKNVGDNLLECYHCAPSHKAFVDLVDMTTYEVKTFDNWSQQYGDCRPSNSAYDFDEVQAGACEPFSTIFMFPVLGLVTFPGAAGIATFTFMPIEAELTHQVFTYYSPDGQLTETERRTLDYFSDVLGPEDVGLVESVQQGLRSYGYHQGRFVIDSKRSHTSEHAVHHFHSLVMKALGRWVE
jgi:choline monooxygenase